MPPSATGAAYGLRAQIFSEKLPLGIPFMYNQYLESHSPEKNTPETPPLNIDKISSILVLIAVIPWP